MRRALFLDRDGTLNVEVNYLSRPEDLVLIDGAAEALAEARRQGWAMVVITNQAGVGRGYFTLETLERIHAKLTDELARYEVALDGIYACIHHPDDGCRCRKPEPGMILTAAADLNIDPTQSWMIGDRASDLEAGRRAGCRTALVLTGYGAVTAAEGYYADLVAPDLPAVVRCILEREAR
ncbi:MAG: D-glycero-beta-D-manno-heptose 1,7-bisphosphate 7-phosphatase [Chloroflexota bacterium]|nr:D-glycero-beta-D-manno-heptose 1,7-bisphosphate 7-phosphatase [Dehalococcoidia bacterium]MDW8252476.1 D-glycero-beta-D-manno-heptose 1,7-bisphosphate 7-phosphatase [Chloroflexota bacterium]